MRMTFAAHNANERPNPASTCTYIGARKTDERVLNHASRPYDVYAANADNDATLFRRRRSIIFKVKANSSHETTPKNNAGISANILPVHT